MSSNTLYTQYTRLSDALERELMREALSCGDPVSIADIGKSVWSGLKKAVSSTGRFVVATTRSMEDDRLRNTQLLAYDRARNSRLLAF